MMTLKEINQLIPYKKLLSLLLLFAVSVQIIIISYNHYSGFYHLAGTQDFLIRLVHSSVLSFFASMLIAYPDLMVIQHLNRRHPWSRNKFARVILQLSFTLVIGIASATIITLIAHVINPYTENLRQVFVANNLIMVVINILLMAVLESAVFFNEVVTEKKRTEALNKELDSIRFEMLKRQINPHFLFNSLNVLSGLVHSDADKAQDFIDEFSHLYRYVLDTIEKPVVSLEQELDFIHSYMFLQKIRYGKNVDYDVNIPAQLLNKLLPPLSLQIVFENAIKHNRIDDDTILRIQIGESAKGIAISNNYEPKVSRYHNTGIGQNNLIKRYTLLGSKAPSFHLEGKQYIAELPLINYEAYESSNH